MDFNIIGLLLGNWRIFATVLALAAIFYRIDDRAYQSGVDSATAVCIDKTVPAIRLIEQEACLANLKRVETSNENLRRDKDSIGAKHDAALKRLREASKRPTPASSDVAAGPATQLPISGTGRSLGERILEFSRDAATRDAEFNNCRSFVLDAISE